MINYTTGSVRVNQRRRRIRLQTFNKTRVLTLEFKDDCQYKILVKRDQDFNEVSTFMWQAAPFIKRRHRAPTPPQAAVSTMLTERLLRHYQARVLQCAYLTYSTTYARWFLYVPPPSTFNNSAFFPVYIKKLVPYYCHDKHVLLLLPKQY
jgi:hypothetical protein